ncbi:TauD/TfdA family dioxygenase [Amycolatopsis anabasis]|uniref:TauD/TfdA family dioxygenase n=1 Tax=Amycolatopsis anabasis TaxID=1840409 RepID=UPI001FE520F0|nr:TauD/TfdA family dioxygenase [Amycolatopsis anabasis]
MTGFHHPFAGRGMLGGRAAPVSARPAAPDVVLGPDEAAAFERIACALCLDPRDRVDEPAWVARARFAWESLPESLRRSVRQFRRNSGSGGVLLLHGLPIGEPALPPTPALRDSVQRSASVAAAGLLLIACGLGDPIAFSGGDSGALVRNVVPVAGREEAQDDGGSVLRSFHTEHAFHPHRPDFVLLLCLRADHERVAALRTACARETLPLLDDETKEALFTPDFGTEPPSWFGGAGATHAVLSGVPDDPGLRVDLETTTSATARGKAALVALAHAFDTTTRTVRLNPGDLAIVDNRVTVLGRSAFHPRYDGRDRWLQRALVAADLRRSRDHRPGDGYVLTR